MMEKMEGWGEENRGRGGGLMVAESVKAVMLKGSGHAMSQTVLDGGT